MRILNSRLFIGVYALLALGFLSALPSYAGHEGEEDTAYFVSRLNDITPESGVLDPENLPERRLRLYNVHTKERIDVTFWKEGSYDHIELARLDYFLRDWRSGDVKKIERTLITLIFYMKMALQQDYPHIADQEIEVISGYRSPETNRRLKKMGRNVSTQSRHMYGMAIDIRFPGVPVSVMRDVARKFNIGGVGAYPHGKFIHIDTGRVRYW